MQSAIDFLAQSAQLTPLEFGLCALAVFFAGVVRGFSGFALSALVMASVVLVIPPVELIAVCWLLEMSASAVLVRGGVKEADRGIAFGLVAGSIVGVPIGLWLTTTLPIDQSKLIALLVILFLAVLQLLKVRMGFLATKPGLYTSGLTAGVATGLASVGGMVVALYVLSQNAAARTMRASLVLFLFVSSLFSFLYLLAYGMMDMLAISRGLLWVPVCVAGVMVGKAMFRPNLEPYYRPFCLVLLMGLAVLGLTRLASGM